MKGHRPGGYGLVLSFSFRITDFYFILGTTLRGVTIIGPLQMGEGTRQGFCQQARGKFRHRPESLGSPAAPPRPSEGPLLLPLRICLHPGREHVGTCHQGRAQLSPSQLLGPWCVAARARPPGDAGGGGGKHAASDPPEAGREAGQEPQLQCSTLCYSLPPCRPLPPGSRPGLTPCFPPGHVPPPHWTKGRADGPWWGLPGGNCLPGRNPRSLTQSPGCTAAHQCVLILTSLRCKSPS